MFDSLRKKISYRAKRAMFRPSRRTIHVAGESFEISIDDVFAENVYRDSRRWPELEWARENFQDAKGLVFDVGANQGITTLFYARRFPSALVVAAEPHPFNAAQILRNARANGVGNLAVLPCAVSGRAGEVRIVDHSNSSVVADGGIPVPAVRLDDLRTGCVRFLKIDVEGLEDEVLDGAGEILSTDRPPMDVEVHLFFRENPLDFLRNMVDRLERFGYQFDAVAGYQGDLVRNAGEADWERLSREKVVNLLCRPQ
jgi:FkbM family methyltransferase